MKNTILEIPSMQSAHCQARVQKALAQLPAVALRSQEAGRISLDYGDEAALSQAIDAIEQAGYAVNPGAKPAEGLGDLATGDLLTFKTNIHCASCVATVTPALDALDGVAHWEVATGRPDKLLTLRSIGATEAEVIAAVRQAGYQIESLSSTKS